MKAKSINQIKYASIIEFLDAYVNNIQNDYERFKERNGPTNIYDDKQLKLLKSHETAVKIATSLKTQFDNWYLALSSNTAWLYDVENFFQPSASKFFNFIPPHIVSKGRG